MEDKKFEVKMMGSDGEKYYVILNDKDDVEELTDFVFDETNCEVSVRPIEKEEEQVFRETYLLRNGVTRMEKNTR